MSVDTTNRRAGDVRFLKDVFFLSISPLILRARSFLLIPIIVRVLGIEGYGIWAQFEVTSALAVTVLSLNLGMGLNRFLAGDVQREQLSDDVVSTLSLQLALGVLAVLPLLLAPGWVAGVLFGRAELAPLSVALAVCILCSLVGNSFWGMMRAQRHTQAIALINSVRWWGELIVIVVALLVSRSLVVLFSAFAAYQLFANAAYPLYALRKGWFRPTLPRFTRTRAYIQFSLPLFGETLGYWVANSSDKYIVRWLLGIEALGVYSALYKFGSVIMMLLEPLMEVLLPDTASLYDQRRLDEMERRFMLTTRYFAIVAALGAIGIVGAAPLLVTIAGLDLADMPIYLPLLASLTVGGIAMGIGRILHDLCFIKGRTALIGSMWIGLGVLNTLANIVFIPWAGLLGAAIATALTFIVGLAVVAAFVHRLFPEFRLWAGWSWNVAAALVVGLLIAWIVSSRLSWLLPLGSAAGAAAFLLVLIVTGTVGRRERDFVRSLARGRRPAVQEKNSLP